MNYVKSFWTSVPSTSSSAGGGEVISQASTTTTTAAPSNYNSVTFTTTTDTLGSSKIIITTVPQNPQQIVYHKNHQQVADMASPTESYHSASSTLEHQTEANGANREGKVNLGFNGSSEINNNNSNISSHAHNQVVHREQYWSWSFPWNHWNQREKIFLIVIVILSLCVLTLTSLLSVLLPQNLKYKETLLQNGLSVM